MSGESFAAVRIDRWLWAARAFRSRSLAAQACSGGKVSVNGVSAKPHKLVRPDDLVGVTTSLGVRQWRVLGIAERRGPAAQARALYDDLTPPPLPGERPAEIRQRGEGRPTKRDRRRLDRFRMR